MAVHIVRLGTPRSAGEGLRIGTVRRPPRGVPKRDWAAKNFYDVWYPVLAPSAATLKEFGRTETEAEWRKFARRYRREMSTPDAAQALQLLAQLSHVADFAVGCYCADEDRCHRAILRELLIEHGAKVRKS